MHRLFVGIRPPSRIRDQLLSLMGGVPGARWQVDDQLHCTVRFIGEVDRPTAEDIADALGRIRFPAFEIALDGVGQFDTRGRPNALWAGLRPHGDIARLHKKVDQACVSAGAAPERRAYLPHVTLARLNAGAGMTAGFLAEHGGLTSEPFAIGHFTLFQSHLGRDGASYMPIERYELIG